MSEWLLGLMLLFVQSNPNVAAILSVIAILRVTMKPLMALLQTIVDATPYDTDNKWLADAQVSPFYKGLCFILDWTASIKLPAKDVAPKV